MNCVLKIIDGEKTTYDKTKNITRFLQWVFPKESVKKKRSLRK